MSTYTHDEVEFGQALEDLNHRALESTFARIKDGKVAGCTLDNVKVRREW
jgi:glutamine cyclotransferase